MYITLTNMKPFAPVVLFVYNRLEHTKRTVGALHNNILAKNTELFIFSDGTKNDEAKTKVKEVRNYLKTISGFRSVHIIERNENCGLAKSVISGVTETVNKFGKIIVLEDDLVTSPYFLQYMNDALALYEHEEKVISIHGYVYPVKKSLPKTFFLRGADCWGWATWKRGWNLFELDGKKLLKELEGKNLVGDFDFDGSYNYSNMLKRQIDGLNDSWAIRWYASAFLANKLTLYPGKSLIQNIGQDATGTHGGNSNKSQIELSTTKINVENIDLEENGLARQIFKEYFKSLGHSFLKRVAEKINQWS